MYFPNLRLKRGERIALNSAKGTWNDKVEVVWHFEDEDELANAKEMIEESWQGNNILNGCDHDLGLIDSSLLEMLSQPNFRLAVSPEQIANLSAKVKELYIEKSVLRIELGDMNNILSDVQEVKEHLQGFTPLPKNTLLIIDFLEVSDTTLAQLPLMHQVIDDISTFTNCKNLVVVSGAFPSDVSQVIGVSDFERYDREIYNKLVNDYGLKAFYGDWCTIHPEWNFTGIRRSNHCNIRYTHDTKWYVFRQNGRDGKSVISLTNTVLIHPCYRGRQFSWADNEWFQKVHDPSNTGPGNPTNHTSEAIHHHIAQILKYG